ncbi:c-type heme family protein [Winogradskyella alexanderae]|uniref:DUF3365 domain-containing protein n=1 Tax=Winogradskyella alexanderae TaxID=2877123 RepID=A0ABS7XRW4_9FLAO|nr:DUF3365 domain-containing protein [Winogradskyella alexanderae]MCA0131692.1 DUF3365 domain-containing protein [Winogradskyella alexanderae]
MKHVILIIAVAITALSCNNSNSKNLSAFDKQLEANKHPGKKLMETHCYVCHSPDADHDNRIGPPMIAIKKHYINEETSKEEFIESITSWINNPNEKDAKMKGAVRRFGVMPKQAFPENAVEQIADYLFDYEIEQPEWFEEHFNEEKGKQHGQGQGKGHGQGKGKGKGKGRHQQQAHTEINSLPYGERGLKYALSTKAVLGKNLMGTIQKKGTLEALNFCNVRAYPLTDSMATTFSANIKRVSDKPRNPFNQANETELDFINKFKNDLKDGNEIKPAVIENENTVTVYYPITTNSMCLQCHGKIDKDIVPEVSERLATLYPKDKAVGYDINQVRGIWNITYSK